MTPKGTATMSADAIRGYIRTLRLKRGKTQAEAADGAGMKYTTYKDWEYGITKSIKTPNLLRLVRYLSGSIDQIIGMTDDDTDKTGEALAEAWAATPLAVAIDSTQARDQAEDIKRVMDYLRMVADGTDPERAARAVLPEPER